MRYFGSSAPASGAGPVGQFASLLLPARIAAPKLVASVLLRPGISLGAMVSPGAAGGISAAAEFGAEPDALLTLAAVATGVDFAELSDAPDEVEFAATSPELAVVRGRSA